MLKPGDKCQVCDPETLAPWYDGVNVDGVLYFANEDMEDYCGEIVTIAGEADLPGTYRIAEDNEYFYWHEEWIIPLDNSADFEARSPDELSSLLGL